jgi:hypothetical protein
MQAVLNGQRLDRGSIAVALDQASSGREVEPMLVLPPSARSRPRLALHNCDMSEIMKAVWGHLRVRVESPQLHPPLHFRDT